MTVDQENSIAWLVEIIDDLSSDYSNSKQGMEENLMKISGVSYAMKAVLNET